MNLNKHVKSDSIKWIIAFLLIIGIVITSSVLLVRVSRLENKQTVSTSVYSRGGLNSTGGYVDTDESIYTKKYISAKGLEVSIVEDATVTYELFFYQDIDGKHTFMTKSGSLRTDLAADSEIIPEGADYVRIVITPLNDDNISLFEVRKYAKQITVKHSK